MVRTDQKWKDCSWNLLYTAKAEFGKTILYKDYTIISHKARNIEIMLISFWKRATE